MSSRPIRAWSVRVPDSALGSREADADDADLDTFDTGDDEFALEVNAFFRNRGWKKIPGAICLQFGTRTEIVGYAAIGERSIPHPSQESVETADYVIIYVMGVTRALHGEHDPGAPDGTSFAMTIFRTLETGFAKGLTGLSLHVRTRNGKAIHFYEESGFGFDPEGDFIDCGKPTRIMRKILDR